MMASRPIGAAIWRAAGEAVEDRFPKWPEDPTTTREGLLAGRMALVDLLLVQVLLRIGLICNGRNSR